ncbi:MAG: cation:proton antiporter [Gammaproteobacteria bacterium]|nr:cation:proton antiporter [Gammaproteobacteria bacterium]
MITTTVWLSAAFILGLGARLLGLPPLIGFLAAGFGLSYLGQESNAALEQIAHVGVLILLFSVGLKLRLKSLLRVEVLAGSLLHLFVSSVLFVGLLYFWYGLATKSLILLAIALSFSSTVIAAKILEVKKELRAFHGRVTVGILIIQDLIAVGMMGVAGGHSPSPWAGLLVLSVFALRPVWYRLLDLSGHGELLVLYGVMLALVVGASGFEYFGVSSELGALLLGVVLAEHKRASELSHALWGMKEVLLVGFFVQIGLAGHPTLVMVGSALLLNLLLPLKALLFFFILLLFRLRARSSFLAGLSLATYSEFGLIIANLGVQHGWMEASWLVLLAVTVALSFLIAAPLNVIAHDLYLAWESGLQRFESRQRHPDDKPIMLGNSHIVVFGMGRIGTGSYDNLTQRQHRVIGLDSDPLRVEQHRQAGRRVLYADAEDPGLWEKLDLSGVRAILVVVPDLEAKRFAIRQLRQVGFRGFISSTAVFGEEVAQLQKDGANTVYNYYDGVGASFAEAVVADIPTSAVVP